jgi:hypothetical protein
MGSFSPKALDRFTQKVREKNSGGRVFHTRQDLAPDKPVFVRLQKPMGNQGGEWQYAVEIVVYWINGKKYIVCDFLGWGNSIQEVIDEARSLNDPQLDELLDVKNNDDLSISTEYMMPGRVVTSFEVDEDSGLVTSVKIDPKKDIIQANSTMFTQIHDIVVSPGMERGKNGNGIFDEERGMCIVLSKTGKGRDTRYKALLDSGGEMPMTEVPAFKKPANIIQYLEKVCCSPEFGEAAIRNYLYGEEMPETDVWKKNYTDHSEEDADDDQEETAPARKAAPAKRAPVKAAAKEEEEPVEKPTRKAPPARKGKPNLKSALETLEDEFEDE